MEARESRNRSFWPSVGQCLCKQHRHARVGRSQELVRSGPDDKPEFTRLGNDWPLPQDIESLVLDGVQNFLSAAAEEFKVDRQLAIHFLDQRQSAIEPFARTLDLEPHELKELRRCATLCDIVSRHTETAQIFQRQIDASFAEVHGNILPEIGELQCGAGVIRELLALGVTVSAEVEHKMSNRIRGITAVSQNVVKCFKARDCLVLAEGDQQIGKLMLWNIALANRRRERNEDGMLWRSSVTGVKLRFPLVK